MDDAGRRRAPLAVKPTESMDTDFSVDSPGAVGGQADSGRYDSRASSRRRSVSSSHGMSGDSMMPPRAAAPHDDNIGRVLGSYRLISLLGEGGMGRVYRAEHTMLGRNVALKLLRPEYAAKRDAVHRFFQEARAVNAIGHANIVDVTDYVELESGETFFIMELLEGSNLGQLIRDREEPIPVHKAMNIALQVCDALQAAHEKRIVHRDLKPDNVFVIDDPDKGLFVKLLDFGVAKLMGEAAAELSWETAAGSVLGTPAYMSPEQATGLEVDHRTDIYSLGAILYEMFTGHPVFRAKSFGEFVLKHMNEVPIPPSEIPDGPPIPNALEQVIERCLEKDPLDRYQSVNGLREDLARATATMQRSIRRKVRKHRRGGSGLHSRVLRKVLATISVVSVVGLAGAAFWFAAGLGEDSSSSAGGELVEVGLAPVPPSLVPHGSAPLVDPDKTAANDAAAGQGAATAARVRLLSQPQGASVYRKGEPISLGTTPLVLTLPNPGGHIDLVFRLPGYEDAFERVRVLDNAVVSVALEPIGGLYADPTGESATGDDRQDVLPARSARAERRRAARGRGRQEAGARRKARRKAAKPTEIKPEETLDPFGVK